MTSTIEKTFLKSASNYDYIMMTIPNIHGQWMTKTFPSREANLLTKDVPVSNIFNVFGINNDLVLLDRCAGITFFNLNYFF